MRPSERALAWEAGQVPTDVDTSAEWLPDNEVTAMLSWEELRAMGITTRVVGILDSVTEGAV